MKTRLRYEGISGKRAAELLHAGIRRHPVDHFLFETAKLWGELASETEYPKQERKLWPAIQMHQLAYLAMASIRYSNDHRGQPISRNEYFNLANLYNIAQGNEIITMGDTATFDDIEEFFLGTAYQQFSHQGSLAAQIPRALHLFQDLALDPEVATVFDIAAALEHKLGTPITAFMRVGLALFVLRGMTNSGRFFEAADIGAANLPGVTTKAVEQFLTRAATEPSLYPG